MPTQLQFRRGTTAQNNSFTGAAGEISVDTTTDTLRLHDGATAGGFEIVTLGATQTLTNKSLTSPTITGSGAIAGTFTGNITGNVTGNADTATTLQTARTINGVSFNGSANITVEPYISDDDTGDTNCPVLFSATSTAGYKRIYEDSAFYFNNTANTLVVTNITGTSSAAKYADLAERYTSDSNYEAGTVLVFGGDEEVTESTQRLDKRIAGIVSTDPAYLMNSALENSVAVGLQGRVPCKVVGEINKGDMMVSSSTPGHAQAWQEEGDPPMGSVIGKSLENKTGTGEGVVEVVVGRI